MAPGAPTPSQASPPQPPAAAIANPTSPPPNKRDLKSWWKGFKLQAGGKAQDTNGTDSLNLVAPATSGTDNLCICDEDLQTFRPLQPILTQHDASAHAYLWYHYLPVVEPSDATSKTRAGRRPRSQGIFGVPLRQSITYANVAISLVDENGSSYIYGYVPIVVAKCGVFLKEKATEVEGIFRLSGSEKRIKELKTVFDSPDRYGKGLVWEGYTVHDASNVFRRYLNDLPEPVVPLDLYAKFREPLRGATKHGGAGDAEGPQFVEGFDEATAIAKYQQLITELPPLHRQLLLYILDLLAVFAAKAEINRMNAQNLAAIFQPGMLSHPDHAMAPEEYRLNQCVLIFLIENQDHFLIGMQGTAADEQTKQEVEQGTTTPVIAAPVSPVTPTKSGSSQGLGRTGSNASAAAESVRLHGMIRRNRSTSSRHSRHDSTGTAPGSPALATTPTGGLTRSNTLPSKKSPALPAGRFQKDASPVPFNQSGLSPNTELPPTYERAESPSPSTLAPSAAGASTLSPSSAGIAGHSQDKLVDAPPEPVSTPVKERNLQSLFQRSPTSESDRKPRNKLKKRVGPGGLNPSAHSSTGSLGHSNAVSPGFGPTNPTVPPEIYDTAPTPLDENQQFSSPAYDPSESTPRGATMPPATRHPESSLKPQKSPPASLHSSFNEGSEFDHVDEPPHPTATVESEDGEKRKRWRLSRGLKKEENRSPYLALASPRQTTGSNLQAESNTSIASGGRPRKSFTNDSSEPGSSVMDAQAAQEAGFGQRERPEFGGKEESKGPIGWIKNKYREAKETHDQRRAKSPPGDGQQPPGSTSALSFRGKSLDLRREEERQPAPVTRPPQASTQSIPRQVQPQSAPQQQGVPHQAPQAHHISQVTQAHQAPPAQKQPSIEPSTQLPTQPVSQPPTQPPHAPTEQSVESTNQQYTQPSQPSPEQPTQTPAQPPATLPQQ
ncbi:related to Rho GTPase activating protein [Cephalotrichum gorgonifer]|uniref:Related to Rho GTPase activating protein n=1 Tax=Cephalotrichum gorgonifer TaxID=2041049 RepID=A0AAE8MYM3_9PEZI|nr:related to Rho GTPase activating protein [Cephalotrichum gorgonifer]